MIIQFVVMEYVDIFYNYLRLHRLFYKQIYYRMIIIYMHNILHQKHMKFLSIPKYLQLMLNVMQFLLNIFMINIKNTILWCIVERL